MTSGKAQRIYLGMTGVLAVLEGLLGGLEKRDREGAACLERRLSSLSTCFITFSVSFMRAYTPFHASPSAAAASAQHSADSRQDVCACEAMLVPRHYPVQEPLTAADCSF